MFRTLAVFALLASAPWPPAGGHPALVAGYPDPAAHGDAGEFVVLDVPAGTDLAAYRLTDGERTVRLPATNRSGVVAVAQNGTAARLAGYRVLPVSEFPALANGGERVSLTYGGRRVATLTYGDGADASVWTARGRRPLGATAHRPVTVTGANATAFVLPDSPGPPVDALRDAEYRVLLAGYTLTSTRVADVLVAAARRGVRVRVLLDGAPVGGAPDAQAPVLRRLVDAGVQVRVVGGPRARYAFHHAKYAVADDRAVVITENWKPAGTGGGDSRGWGVVVRDAGFADALAAVFRSDADWPGTREWRPTGDAVRPRPPETTAESYPERFAPRALSPDAVTLAVTPDNADAVVLDVVRSANDTLLVQQVRLGDGRLRRAVVRAAERGVRVRVLLGGAWYVRDENTRLARCLDGYAERAGIPLDVAVAEPRRRYGKVHAKVAVADGERVVLGSLNWNEHALARNREVVAVLDGDAAAAYYGRVFRADWRGGAWRVAASLLAATALAVLGCAGVLRRRVEFEN